jgi:hypothetical protein
MAPQLRSSVRQYNVVLSAVFSKLFDVTVPLTSLFISHGTP